MRKIIEKIDISSRPVFFSLWLACTFLVCLADVWITDSVRHYYVPDLHEANHGEILFHSYLGSVFFNGPVFLFFFILLRHLNYLRSHLGHKVRHDSLTGLLSREAFLNDLNFDYENKIEDRDDALLIIDADFFKNINDTYGHMAGDKALVAITKALRKGVRETDNVGRVGGEEFAIHLKNITADRSKVIAERIRKLVEDASEDLNIPDVKLSVSIGMVNYAQKTQPLKLLEIADRLLYKAKEAGRNRIEAELLKPKPSLT